MSVEEACRLAAELNEEFGDVVTVVAKRTIASLEEDGLEERASIWRACLPSLMTSLPSASTRTARLRSTN
jgi:hypothetical protein